MLRSLGATSFRKDWRLAAHLSLFRIPAAVNTAAFHLAILITFRSAFCFGSCFLCMKYPRTAATKRPPSITPTKATVLAAVLHA